MYSPQRSLVSLLLLSFGTALATGLRAEPGHVFAPVSPQQTALIEAALPKEKLTSAQPRRVLLFYRTEGFVHSSIPVGLLALQRLGEKTGAFTSVASDDMALFAPAKLAEFDAVLFLNSTGLKFTDPVHRQALLEFVRNGKGVAGLHAASDNFPTWPEGQALIGGVFCGHPWTSGEVCAVKLDEPKHVLNLPFGGNGFWVREEIYQITGPYSRERQRVLLSLDMSKPQNVRPPEKIKRTDNDFPISWVKTEGKGRVFYTSLGHREDIYFVPAILRHMLDGLRFALGDLAADAVPSAQAGAIQPALAPPLDTPLQELLGVSTFKKPEAKQPAAGAISAPANMGKLTAQERAAREPALRATLLDAAAPLASKFAALDDLTLAGTADTVPALVTAVSSAEPGLSERAALVLAQLRLPAAETALLKLTESRPAGSRSLVIHALRAYPSSATQSRLAALAKDPNADDARSARAALAAFGTRPALDLLLALPAGADSTPFVFAAADALLRRDPKSAGAVAAIADTLLKTATTPSDRVEAVSLLVKALPPQESARLLGLVRDSEPRVRQLAAAALVNRRQSDALAQLAAIWATLAIDTQHAALSAVVDRTGLPLAQLGLTAKDITVATAGITAVARTADTEAVLALIPRLGETGPVRDAAYAALAVSQAKDLSARLTTAAAKPDSAPAIRVSLVSLLGERQVSDAQSLIVELCASTDATIRAAAFKALGDLAQSIPLANVIELAGNAKKSADQRGFRKALYTSASVEADHAKAAGLLGKALTNPALVDRATFQRCSVFGVI
jgi:type 1 glutamine amidotransferase